jgi:hypothetical protein
MEMDFDGQNCEFRWRVKEMKVLGLEKNHHKVVFKSSLFVLLITTRAESNYRMTLDAGLGHASYCFVKF